MCLVGTPYPEKPFWNNFSTFSVSVAHIQAKTREECWLSSSITLHVAWWDTVSHWTNTGLLAGWLATKILESSCLSSPMLEIQSYAPMFIECWGLELRPSCFHSSKPCPSSHLPSPFVSFKSNNSKLMWLNNSYLWYSCAQLCNLSIV